MAGREDGEEGNSSTMGMSVSGFIGGERETDWTEKTSCQNSQLVQGFRVQASFLRYFSNTGYRAGNGRFRQGEICLQMWPNSSHPAFNKNKDLEIDDLFTKRPNVCCC